MGNNITEIQKIVQAIDLTAQRRLLLYGQPVDEEFSNPYIAQPNNKMLFESLQQTIYNVFYSKNTKWRDYVNRVAGNGLPSFAEIEDFMNDLSQQNLSQEHFDAGWMIEYIDTQGQIISKKGNYTRSVYPGEFLNDSRFHHLPATQQQIRLFSRKEHKDVSTGFYYIFGNTITEDNADQLVRLYFNINPDGIRLLIALITQLFNDYQVPFEFKCVNHPYFYSRCDAAVLYFEKRYSSIAFLVIQEIHKQIKQHLLPQTPLFTKALAEGIGFAENPKKTDESFGTHISKMLAQGIMNAIIKNAPKQYWVQEITTNIEVNHKYKNIEVLYLNPDSKYPYNFPQPTENR